MKNMYAISIGLAFAGAGCVLAEKSTRSIPGNPSFELTVIGYLLISGGLMLLIACLAASADAWLRARRRRACAPPEPDWERHPPPIVDHH